MRVVHVLERLGGVADVATLRVHTSRRKIRTALSRGDIVCDARGRYALPHADRAVRAANRLSAIVSHASAAAYYGWEMKSPQTIPTLTVRRNRNVNEERRRGLKVAWADYRPQDIVDRLVTAPARTVIDCAKTMPFDEALAIADSAIRHRDVTRSELLDEAERVKGKGRRNCLRVAREANGEAANPFESVLRAIALDVKGLDPAPQVVLTLGSFRGRPDLVDVKLRIVIEAESFEFHGKRKALERDCARYNALVIHGWRVVRFSWERVMFRPAYVATCLSALVQGPVQRADFAEMDRISA
jgi:hypothetical protein